MANTNYNDNNFCFNSFVNLNVVTNVIVVILKNFSTNDVHGFYGSMDENKEIFSGIFLETDYSKVSCRPSINNNY